PPGGACRSTAQAFQVMPTRGRFLLGCSVEPHECPSDGEERKARLTPAAAADAPESPLARPVAILDPGVLPSHRSRAHHAASTPDMNIPLIDLTRQYACI